jgi:signal transduction histidine kinase
MRLFKGLLLFCFFAITNKGFSQFPGLDKAREKIYNSKTDKERLDNLMFIVKFKNSMSSDSITHYAQWTKKLAIQLKNDKALAWAEQGLIAAEMVKGNTDSVIPRIERNQLFTQIKKTDAALYYKIELLKANILNRQNKRIEALDLELKLLSEAEKDGNTLSKLFLLNYIGATYSNTSSSYEESKKTWLSALEIINKKDSIQFKEIEAYILSNLSVYYLNKFYAAPSKLLSDTCFNYLSRTVTLSREIEAAGVLASVLTYRGNFYGYKKMFINGEADFKEALDIRKKIGDPLYVTEDYKNLSDFYFQSKQYEKCLTIAQEGLEICKKNNIKETELAILFVTGRVYKTTKKFDKYSETLEKIISLSDSSNQKNAAEKIADIQTKYEVQKKETLITKQKLDLVQRNILLYSTAALAVALALFFGYQFKKYQQKQKEVAEQKRIQSALAVKDAEEKERKRISAELHDNLGVQANAILHNSTLLTEVNTNQKNIVTDLQDTAKEMLFNLRETLWAMKTSDVTANDLWMRIINFIKQMGRHYTTIGFKIEGEVSGNFIIPSNKALNIVLILQEAVNNAVKHALPTEITATSITNENGWSISITDDGKGFDLDSAKNEQSDSYGLGNMQERATASAIILSISSEIGKGTTITLIL